MDLAYVAKCRECGKITTAGVTSTSDTQVIPAEFSKWFEVYDVAVIKLEDSEEIKVEGPYSVSALGVRHSSDLCRCV